MFINCKRIDGGVGGIGGGGVIVIVGGGGVIVIVGGGGGIVVAIAITIVTISVVTASAIVATVALTIIPSTLQGVQKKQGTDNLEIDVVETRRKNTRLLPSECK